MATSGDTRKRYRKALASSVGLPFTSYNEADAVWQKIKTDNCLQEALDNLIDAGYGSNWKKPPAIQLRNSRKCYPAISGVINDFSCPNNLKDWVKNKFDSLKVTAPPEAAINLEVDTKMTQLKEKVSGLEARILLLEEVITKCQN